MHLLMIVFLLFRKVLSLFRFSDARSIGKEVEHVLCASGANCERQKDATDGEAARNDLEIRQTFVFLVEIYVKFSVSDCLKKKFLLLCRFFIRSLMHS